MGLHGLLGDSFTFFNVDYVHTSQRTYVRAFTASYGESFDILYVDHVRTSQGTHVRAFTACYGEIFTALYVDDDLPHREHTYEPSRPVTGRALIFYM
jgi:hypothetical protein